MSRSPILPKLNPLKSDTAYYLYLIISFFSTFLVVCGYFFLISKKHDILFDKPTVVLLFNFSVVVWLLWTGVYYLLSVFFKRLIVRAVLPTIAVVGYLYSDIFHYLLFKEHLNYEAISLVALGLLSNEVNWFQNLPSVLLSAIAVLVLLVALCMLIHRLSAFLPAMGRSIWLVNLLLMLFLFMFSKVQLAECSVSNSASNLRDYIPWKEYLCRFEYEGMPDYVGVPFFDPDSTDRHLLELSRSTDDLELRPKKKPNLLFVHMESVRSDVLNKENMPFLAKFGKSDGVLLPRHYSSGNNTGASIFGLLSGLSGAFYSGARVLDTSPVPLKILQDLGYKQSVYYTKDMMYDGLYPYFFSKTENFRGSYGEGDFAGKEKKMIKEYLDSLDDDESTEPRVDYLIFYATHYDYYYPPEFEYYKPAEKLGFDISSSRGGSLHMRTKKQALFNRYRNSAKYLDSLIEVLVTEVDRKGLLDNTILVIVGDHGEEFWEKGRFGHSYGISNEQTQVGAVLYFPDQYLTEYEGLSSHSDIFPTIWSFMGLSDELQHTYTGSSLKDRKDIWSPVLTTVGTVRNSRSKNHVVTSRKHRISVINDTGGSRILRVYDEQDEELVNYDMAEILKFVTEVNLESGAGLAVNE